LYAAHDIGPTGSYAEVADGIFYRPNSDTGTLKFSNRDFTSTAVLATGDPISQVGVIIKYSNP